MKAISPPELTKRVALIPHLPHPEATAPAPLQLQAAKEADTLAHKVRNANSTQLVDEIISDFERLNPKFSLSKSLRNQVTPTRRPPLLNSRKSAPLPRRPPLPNTEAPIVAADFFPFEHLLCESSPENPTKLGKVLCFFLKTKA